MDKQVVYIDASAADMAEGTQLIGDRLLAATGREKRFAAVVVMPTRAGEAGEADGTGPGRRRLSGIGDRVRMLKRLRPGLRQWCCGLAFVASHEVQQAGAKAIRAGARMWGCPTRTFDDVDAAGSWAEQQLREPRRGGGAALSVIATAVFVLLAACSGTGDGGDSHGTESGSTGPGVERTVEGEYGPVTLTGDVQRVVALSSDWLGTMAAADAPLVGYRTAGPAAPVDTPSWLEDALPASADHLTGEFSAEEVAALDPDLIVGPSWLIDEDTYGALSDVAPTFVDHEDSAGTQFGSWERQIDSAGTLLGTDTDATKEALQDDIREAAEIHHLDGQAALAVVQGDQIGAVTSSEASVSYLLEPFGLEPVQIPGQQVGVRTMVSQEESSRLRDADLLIIGPSDTAPEQLGPFTDGRDDDPTAMVPMAVLNAFNTPDASSIPVLLDVVTSAIDPEDAPGGQE